MPILKATSNAEILSYIINETPELKEEMSYKTFKKEYKIED